MSKYLDSSRQILCAKGDTFVGNLINFKMNKYEEVFFSIKNEYYSLAINQVET